MLKGTRLAKIISIMLCVMMVVALFPVRALATDGTSGEVGGTEVSESEETDTDTPTEEVTEPPVSTDIEGEDDTLPPEPPTEGEQALEDASAPTEFTVRFLVGDSEFASVTVPSGGTVSEPASAPATPSGDAYAGLVFYYWVAAGSSAPYNFSTPVTAGLTLYAIFGEPTTDGDDTTDGKDEKTEENTTDGTEGVEQEDELAELDGNRAFSAFGAPAPAAGGIGEDSVPLMTYTFDSKGTIVSTQIVADQDTLYDPGTPAADVDERFIGWYDGDILFTSYGVQSVTTNGALALTAWFAPAVYVFFHSTNGAILETREPDATGVVSTSGVLGIQVESLQLFAGWSTRPGGAVDVGDSITLGSLSIDLYPVVKNAITVSFQSNGGTYVSPMLVAPGSTLNETMVNDYVERETGASIILRTGYSFTGWSGFHFGDTIDSDTVLSAQWSPASVAYTVVYWQQSAANTSVYNVVPGSMITRYATAGSVVSPTNDDRKIDYTGFDYNATKSVSVTVAGDGSSQLNIYFNRETWRVEFYVPKKNAIGAYTSAYQLMRSSVPGLFGSDIGYWPSNSETDPIFGYNFDGWRVGSKDGAKVAYLDQYINSGEAVFSGGVLKLYAKYVLIQSVQTYTVNHYFQDLTGAYPASSRVVTTGTYATVVGVGSATITLDNMMTGFTATSYNTNSDSTLKSITPGSTTVKVNTILYIPVTDTVNVYHQRNSYTLKIYNGGSLLSSTAVLFEKSLTSYQPAQPDRPAGLPTNYVWGGWYTTQQGDAGSEMNWGALMPAGDTVVYGVWRAPVLSGVAYLSVDGSSTLPYNLGSIAYGGTISASVLAAAKAAAIASNPNVTDTFGGWMIKRSGSLSQFSPTTLLYQNVELYVNWIRSTSYAVTYALNGATGTTTSDSTAYLAGAEAKVRALEADVVAPEGKVFLGWLSSADGKLYYPGGVVTIGGALTLTAQWGDKASLVSITYYGNGGKLSGGGLAYSSDPIANNTLHTVLQNDFTKEGFDFIGWNTESGGTGTWYWPEALIRLNANSKVSGLYAQWSAITYSVSLSIVPAGKATELTGAGVAFAYHGEANLSWTPVSGYQTVKVEDNGVEVAFSGDSYSLTNLEDNHNIVVTVSQHIFALTYLANNGTTARYDTTAEKLTSFTVEQNPFSYAGHYFLGWSESASATVPDGDYPPGGSGTMPARDLTLYAVWADQIPLDLTSNGKNVNYNAAPQSVDGYTASIATIDITGISAGVTQTDPGVYTAAFNDKDALVITRGGVVVTEQYDVSWIEGTLTINPRVSYIDNINREEYASEFVAYGTGDARYLVTPPANVTDGEGKIYYWDGTYSVSAGDPTASDLKENFEITANYTLNKTLTITGRSDKRDYNTALQTITRAKVSDTSLTVTGYSVYGGGTNVGAYDVLVTLGADFKIMSGGVDVTNQYTVVTVPGKLTIQPIDMAVSATGYNGVYDGNAYGITVTPDVLEGTEIAYSRSRHNKPAGYKLADSPMITDVDDSLTVYFVVTNPNYNPYFDSADITITPAPITVKATSKSWVYDTLEHTWPRYTVVSGSFVGTQGIRNAIFDAASKITNAGTEANTITGLTLKNNTNAQNYSFTYQAGVLTVTQAPGLSVTASDSLVQYNGQKHTIDVNTNIPTGTEFYYSLTGGTNLSTYSALVIGGLNVIDSRTIYVAAVNPNYITAFDSALLTITPRAIMLTSETASKDYDGTPLTGANVTVSGDLFATGEGFATEPTSTVSITNFGTLSNTFAIPAMATGTDAGNYTIDTDYGTLTVERRLVLVIVDDATKNYGDPDPVFTYQFGEGTYLGRQTYAVLPSDLAGAAISVYRVDAALPTAEDPGEHNYKLYVDLGVGSTIVNDNYTVWVFTGSLIINPQITYLPGTTDAVTGMPATEWAPYDTNATLSSGLTAARIGYVLIGWLDQAAGTKYALGATLPNVKTNTQLTAQWSPNLYNVSFLSGTGAAVANMPATIVGAAYSTAVKLSALKPTRAGFTFAGWQSSDVDGTANVYGADETFVMPNRAVTFTAVWTPNLYSVTYIANYAGGGSFTDGTHETLSTVTVAANSFVRKGYRFLGWSESATGAVARQPGSTFLMPTNEITFYAKWEKQSYDVVYYVTGGTGAGLDGATPYATYTGLGYGDTVPVPENPVLSGYTFGGWVGLPATVPEGGLTIRGALTALQAPAGPLVERVDEAQTPLAGKQGLPLWAIIAGSTLGAGLLGFGVFFLFFRKKKKEDEVG